MAKKLLTTHKILIDEVFNDPDARAEYDAFKLHLELAEKLKKAREFSHLTQKNVAQKMATLTPAVARLEAAGGRGKHSPSVATVAKYAQAVGCRLEIKLVRLKNSSP